MGRAPQLPTSFTSPRRRRRRPLLLVLVVGLCLLGAYVYLTRPQRLVRLANELLASMTGAAVDVEDARFDLSGTIQLTAVSLRVPSVNGEAGRLFEAGQVTIEHDLLDLIRGRFEPRSLTFIRPTLYLTELPDQGKFNYQLLPADNPRAGDMPGRLPEVFVRGGRVSFAELEGDTFLPLGELRLYGTMTADPEQAGAYRYSLIQEQPDGAAGPTLSGRFDLKTLKIEGKLERFILDRPQRNILPRRLRHWWDQRDPEGELPTIEFGYDPDPDVGMFVNFELRNVRINPFPDVPARMTVTSGRFKVSNKTILIDDLVGEIEGFNYTIKGRIDGFSKGAPFQFEATISGDVPTEPRILPGLPEQVQATFGRFTPSGKFEARVNLARVEPDGALSYQGEVDILNGQARYFLFPYPLDDVNGRFVFDDKVLRVVDLRGRGATGAKATVNGTFTPPGKNALVDLIVTSVDAPVDHLLRQALKAPQYAVIEALMDQQAYTRLTDPEHGLVMSTAQRQQWQGELALLRVRQQALETAEATDAEALTRCRQQITTLAQRLARPLFDLGGTATSTTKVHRPLGPDQKYTTVTRVGLAGLNVLIRDWPYPLRITGGSAVVDRDRVILEEVTVRGLAGGTGTISGGYSRDTDVRGRMSPRIKFNFAELPIDEMLLATVPANQRQWLRDSRLDGKADGEGALFRREDDRIDFLVAANISNGGVQPFGGNYQITDLTGRLTFSSNRVVIESAQGRHGSSTLDLSGSIGFDPGGPELALNVGLHQMDLADGLLDLVPTDMPGRTRLGELLTKHEPRGIFDAELAYKHSRQAAGDFRLTMRPRQLSLAMSDRRIDLRSMQGSLVLTPDALELDALKAEYDGGALGLDGRVTFAAEPTIDLTFDLRNRLLCSISRVVMPPELIQALDSLGVAGDYEIRQGRLSIRPNDAGARQTELDCTVELSAASANIGLPVTEIGGDLKLHTVQVDGGGRPEVGLHFAGESLRVADRLVSPLTFQAATDQERERLVIGPNGLLGTCYGGKVVGAGHVRLGGDHSYAVDLTIQDVAMGRFIHPQAEETPSPTSGSTALLGATVSLQGVPGRSASRDGRGAIDVRNAKMYELPLIIAMLHLLNLSLPRTDAFDQAAADFLVNGEMIQFEGIRFKSPSLEVSGTGTMAITSQELDLNMDIRNPGGIKLGPLTDLIDRLRNELIQIHVGGTPAKPQASFRSLQGIKKSWHDVFDTGGDKAGTPRN